MFEVIANTVSNIKDAVNSIKIQDDAICELTKITDVEITAKKEEKKMKNVTFNGKQIKRVIFNGTATVVLFNDGTKAVTHRLERDNDDKEKAMAMALVKSVYGKNYFKDIFETFLPTITLDPNRPIKVGDKVRIKDWDVMVDEFRVDRVGNIDFGSGNYFLECGKEYCGRVVTVRAIDTIDGELFYEEEMDMKYATVFTDAVVHVN